jgi:hypothetical protein
MAVQRSGRASGPPEGLLLGFDVLVQAEKVRWIVDGFECREPVVVRTISRPDAVVAFCAEVVDVHALLGKRLQRGPRAARPTNVVVRLGRIDPEAVKQKVESAYGCRVAAVLPHCDEMMNLASEGLFVLRYPDHPLTA